MASDSARTTTTAIPYDVKIAAALIIAKLALRALDLGLQRLGVTSVLSGGVSSLAPLLWSIPLTGAGLFLLCRRSNGLRIVFAGVTVLGLPFAARLTSIEMTSDPVGALLFAAQEVMQVAAVVFLFRPSANLWFRTA